MSLQTLLQDSIGRFDQRYRAAPRWVVAAPGRANLIGEHVDYNQGIVLPLAIDRYTVITAAAGESHDGDSSRFCSTDSELEIGLAGDGIARTPIPPWGEYVRGVWRLISERFGPLPTIRAQIDSDLPIGAGLSSSASLTVAVATLALNLIDRSLDPIELARLCQQVEHRFAGVPCGLMDPLCVARARTGHLLRIDCRSEEVRDIRLESDELGIMIADSGVHHDLADGTYAQRRSECQSVASFFQLSSLRELDLPTLRSVQGRMPEAWYRRARHVLTEIQRVDAMIDRIEAQDWAEAGSLMFASHDSLRDDYQVSCPELDLLVESAQRLGRSGGVWGSRMTGGGFGGCTVSLIQLGQIEAIRTEIEYRYFEKTGVRPEIFVTRPGSGAAVLHGAP